ncbi:MAG: DNA-binding protein WhiA [Acidaminococcaceae bacterium]|nr:DNA-binding protein WhiA [Acidaminococcaceae bacterium]MBQ8491044.1 DNA-binding protein WhiA [Acidaminococcaceae bacterium]MBQ9258022.1 DNA-binding protein WhiA [Acidaminococcaceae bacterium]
MSYSSDVKNELARLEGQKPCCEKAELLGVLRLSGALVLRGKNIGIHFSTENAALARRVLQVLKSNYPVQTEVVITRSRRLKKNNRYQVEVIPDSNVAKALQELQILPSGEDERQNLLRKACCRKAFLRGVFMAGGSVSRPAGDYHLEIVTENEELARLIVKIMHGFSLSAKMTDRKNNYIVYLKDGDHITDFLSLIGAHQALLEFENVRIVKDMRNQVNRRVNCETANLNKVIRASVLQVACIRYLQEHGRYDLLPEKLKEAAELRMRYPDISLNELVEYTEGTVGKSGLNHRLKKIRQIAVNEGMDISEYV